MAEPIPAEAVQAAAKALQRPGCVHSTSWVSCLECRARIALEAAAPVLAAQARADERRKVAEEIARQIETATPFHWTRTQARAWAARIARQIGEAQ